MTEHVPDSWKPALDPVLATAEARALGGWLRAEEDGGAVLNAEIRSLITDKLNHDAARPL